MGPHRSAFILTIIATIIAWMAWALTITRIDPNATGVVGFVFFYCTLFAAVTGSATVIGLYARRHAENQTRAIRIAIRQGIIIAIAVVVGVFLSSRGLFTWLNMLFLIIALTLLELFWISLGARASGASAKLTADC